MDDGNFFPINPEDGLTILKTKAENSDNVTWKEGFSAALDAATGWVIQFVGEKRTSQAQAIRQAITK